MAESIDEVILNLRAMIISSKGPQAIRDVEENYKETFGVEIPLKTLGCATLPEFFKKNPQNFIFNGKSVQAVKKASTKHIVSLLKQKKNTKKRRRCSRVIKNDDSHYNTVARTANGLTLNTHKKLSEKNKNPARNECSTMPSTLKQIKEPQTQSDNGKFRNRSECSKASLFDLDNKYQTMLMNFCIERRLLMPTYSVLGLKNSNGSINYNCSVSLGHTHVVSTRSKRYKSDNHVKEMAAKKAFKNLSGSNNLTDFICNSKYVTWLQGLCKRYYMPQPVFNIKELHSKGDRMFYFCKLDIGDMSFTSKPVQALDEYMARELVAMKAWDNIVNQRGTIWREI